MNSLKKFASFVFKDNQIRLIFLFSVIYSFIFNLIDFLRYPAGGSIAGTSALFIMSIFPVFFFFLIFSLNKILFNIISAITILLSSGALFYVINYKIRIYLLETLILLLQTDKHEATGIISADLFVYIIVLLLLFGFLLYKINRSKQLTRYTGKIILIIILSPLLFTLYTSRIYMPYAFPYAVKMYNKYVNNLKTPRVDISQNPTTFDEKKNSDLRVIFIIGEAARADHFHINGYARQTSPLLEKNGAIAFPNIDSVHSVTNQSVPRIMTRFTGKDEAISKETSFVSIFNKHKFFTAWISYQDVVDRSYSNIVSFANEAQKIYNIDFSSVAKSGFSVNTGKAIDENMLPKVDDAMKNAAPSLIVLHCMGSHWRFDLHYPDTMKKFTPVCTINNPARCSKEELVNSYDNSILYADFFISQVIDRVRDQNSIIIFCADHGEYLGEGGNYNHPPGRKGREITNPAMFVWMSDVYKKKNPDKYKNALRNRKNSYTTEILFHSVLDAASIEGEIIDKKISIFN